MARPTPESRQAANRFGRMGEMAALAVLILRGYRILARGYSVPGGEIDIIATRRDVLAFVEVKARPTLDAARIAITVEKQRRIAHAARLWVSRHPAAQGYVMRGDAIYVGGWNLPRHEPDAFSLEGR